mmetsp:Transcript_32193/g.49223  ORF Transcript_32193/g.49223 Transcript_32193/m.49223 type:complete len:237 (+) Transcript_32193:503-1213(+)
MVEHLLLEFFQIVVSVSVNWRCQQNVWCVHVEVASIQQSLGDLVQEEVDRVRHQFERCHLNNKGLVVSLRFLFVFVAILFGHTRYNYLEFHIVWALSKLFNDLTLAELLDFGRVVGFVLGCSQETFVVFLLKISLLVCKLVFVLSSHSTFHVLAVSLALLLHILELMFESALFFLPFRSSRLTTKARKNIFVVSNLESNGPNRSQSQQNNYYPCGNPSHNVGGVGGKLAVVTVTAL